MQEQTSGMKAFHQICSNTKIYYPYFQGGIFMAVTLGTDKLKNFINGEWVDVEKSTAVMNPATGEEIVQVPLSGAEDVNDAVEKAKIAQKEWALVPAPQRAEILLEVGNIMKERKERLSQLLTMENGKVLEE